MIQEITNIFHRPRNKVAHKILQHAKRSNDAIIILRQDNALRSLKIEALNLLAIRMLGYENEEIVEHDLQLILPDNIAESVNENLEFDDNGNNIDAILTKIPNFKIKTKDNVEIPIKIKVIRSLCLVQVARFQLVMNDSSLMESLDANRSVYRQTMRTDEVFDKKTSLLTKQSIIRDLELISRYTERSLAQSCLVTYKLNNKSEDRLHDLIKIIQSTKRGNDIVGLLDSDTIVVILPETPQDNIKIAINRIFDKLDAELKSDLKINFAPIKFGTSIESQLETVVTAKAGTF